MVPLWTLALAAQASSFALPPPSSRHHPIVAVPDTDNNLPNNNNRDNIVVTSSLFLSTVSQDVGEAAVDDDDVETNADDEDTVIDVASSSSSTTTNATTLPILFPSLAPSLLNLGLSTPTPIQMASARRALDSENLLLIAPTGSGKTLSYVLPALENVLLAQKEEDDGRRRRRTVLVVAPTRELASQLARDTTSILSNLSSGDNGIGQGERSVLLAVRGIEPPPTPRDLDSAIVLIGTPEELLKIIATSGVASSSSSDFLAGNVLSTVILDEVDVLLPNSPKVAGGNNNDNENKKKKGKRANTPQEERRRRTQKRKLLAAKRSGAEVTSDSKVVGPTELLLRAIAERRRRKNNDVEGGCCQVLAGSATASRKTLDRLNRALRDAALGASSTMEGVWNGSVSPCRPDAATTMDGSVVVDVNGGDNGGGGGGEDHTIRTVTVPRQVTHRYVRLEKERASKPGAVLTAVAQAARVLKPKRALLFLCGDFQQTNAASAKEKENRQPESRERRGRQKTLARKKEEATAAARAKRPARALSAAAACFGLEKLGIEAAPLHVALGLENAAGAEGTNAASSGADSGDNGDKAAAAALPPFLVTFEGAARGLHLDDVDAVFVAGRPASAASYLHLAGRVGRSSTSQDGGVTIRPGSVVSFCTAGSSKELTKWTRQVGGNELEELVVR